VIKFVEVEGVCIGVEIYSSKTATWIFKESKWGEGSIVLCSKSRSIFLNSFMHMLEYSAIVVVDMEGKTWRTIHKLGGVEISIQPSSSGSPVCVLC
jgi:hypothetical protein